jgi:hypothetical protein
MALRVFADQNNMSGVENRSALLRERERDTCRTGCEGFDADRQGAFAPLSSFPDRNELSAQDIDRAILGGRARIDGDNASIFCEMFQLRLPDLAREAPTWDKDHERMTVLLTIAYVMNSDAVRSRDVSVLLGICWETQKFLRRQ